MYTFYVITKQGITDNLTLHKAIEQYKNTINDYKALGVTKEDLYACDLIINNKLSNDYSCMENFKNDKVITVNTINILKKEFDIN